MRLRNFRGRSGRPRGAIQPRESSDGPFLVPDLELPRACLDSKMNPETKPDRKRSHGLNHLRFFPGLVRALQLGYRVEARDPPQEEDI
jgi:hypothetical protein